MYVFSSFSDLQYFFYLEFVSVSGVHWTTPRFSDSPGGLRGLNIAIYVAAIYHSGRIQRKVSKGRSPMGSGPGDQAQDSKSPLLAESHGDAL